jgi:RimJ/RimL family protein N-acetyltransferase
MFEIRAFQEKDAFMLAEVFYEAFGDEVSWGMQQITAEQFVEFSKRPGVKIFVSENEEFKVVAFLTMTEGNIESPAQIHLVAVRQDFQGKGIAKELVRKALEHAKAAGRKKVKLFTRPWNTAMRKVCVELGFVPEAYLRKDFLNKDLVLYSAFLE